MLHYVRENIQAAVTVYVRSDQPQSEWDLDTLYNELNDFFMLYPVITVDDLQGKNRDQMISYLIDHVVNVYESREAEFTELQGEGTMRELERWMALRAINSKWMEHLANMEYLREGIHLRGYEQKDPLLIYQKEAFGEFERMQQAIQDDIVRNIMRVQIVNEPPPQEFPQTPPQQMVAPAIPLPQSLPRYTPGNMPAPSGIATNMDGASALSNRRDDGAPADWKGGRNDNCWCGSGQKYKRCHGK